MTCVASNRPHAFEVLFVDGIHHQQHSAGSLLEWGFLAEVFPAISAVGRVAIDTVHARGGEHPHGVHKLVDGDSLDDLNVLKRFFRELWSLGLSCLAVRHGNSKKVYTNALESAENGSLQSRPRVVGPVNGYC